MDTSLTGRRRNRSWPEALKREIVAASRAPGASVSVVARHYQVNANQIFNWRKRYSDGPQPLSDRTEAQLVPVVMTSEPHDAGLAPLLTSDTIEIEVIGRYRLRVGRGVDGAALVRVLDALERR